MIAPIRLALACAIAGLMILPAATAAAGPEPPLTLPGEATAATAANAPDTWIVGARPVRATRDIARRYRARHIGPKGTGGYVLPRNRARGFANELRTRQALVYAQPDTLAAPLAVPNDPLSTPPNNWRDLVADPALTPPPVAAESPLIALVDAQLDPNHPEFAGGHTTTTVEQPITSSHGTATASVAAAPVNGRGIVGVWPGARALNVPLTVEITCSERADRIRRAIVAGAAVINMSYGSRGICFPEYVALQFAVARGIVPVAAAGNEFVDGNPLEFPASLPHVLTVAAVAWDETSSYFSNTSAAVDLSAPGEDIMTAVPPALDTDGRRDGYQIQSGTSFAAPMVSAAVAWVRAQRPDLTPGQAAQAVRLGTADLGEPGWEPDTGFGLLSLTGALTYPDPPHDPGEPNDDVLWVDGRAFGSPDRPVYRGRRRARILATVDALEDPADVYRIRLRRRSRVRIAARTARGDDVALAVYRRRAKRLRGSRVIERSSRRGRRTERVRLRNRSRRARTYYVAVKVQPRVRDLDATYALRVG